ncbi:unnamed protein product [Symbiodinium microadriaticum]|nr:unnamed protein product [Symbiodinium microadriaticum]
MEGGLVGWRAGWRGPGWLDGAGLAGWRAGWMEGWMEGPDRLEKPGWMGFGMELTGWRGPGWLDGRGVAGWRGGLVGWYGGLTGWRGAGWMEACCWMEGAWLDGGRLAGWRVDGGGVTGWMEGAWLDGGVWKEGGQESLPAHLQGYWPVIEACRVQDEELGKVGYLTVQEGRVEKGSAQRRPGLHTEAPGVVLSKGRVISILAKWGHGRGFRGGPKLRRRAPPQTLEEFIAEQEAQGNEPNYDEFNFEDRAMPRVLV